jgi:predicted HAD superfamily Cof-like phosphohydrolase
MTSWHEDVAEMHDRFGFADAVAAMDARTLTEYLRFRIRFLEEELTELRGSTTPGEVVDALVDLCVVAIGTLDTFGVDPQLAWERVHRANMAKEAGVNEQRKAGHGVPDLVKPPGWVTPDHADNVGLLSQIEWKSE